MIDKKSLTKEWLFEVNEKLGWNRPTTGLVLLEKAISALKLVEDLTQTKLDFIFKGGTSLLLLLDKVFRLSVDADIILETKNADLDNVFAELVKNSELFTRYEKMSDTKNSKFVFYRFYYAPIIDEELGDERYIKLDLYCIDNPYIETHELKIENEILASKGLPSRVKVPSIDCILADKLTAFAPETIGVSLATRDGKRPKRVEVLKQLFDIGNLFDKAENLDNIRKTYDTVARLEIEGHNLKIQPDDVLTDTLKYAYIIAGAGKIDKEKHGEISKGFFGNRGFSRYVVDNNFSEKDAVISASKVVYLVGLIHGTQDKIEKYSSNIDMAKWEITSKEYKDFNLYKITNQEAFFYFYKALEEK